MKVYLVRHGHYLPFEANSDDGFLTDKGKDQIRRLTLRFYEEKINFNKIYSSPKIRAKESAENYCKIAGIEKAIYSESLLEHQIYEDEEDTARRMKSFLDKIKSESPEDNFAIFSHCYAIKYLLNSINPDLYRKVLPHAGVALLDYSKNEMKILNYNPNKHLGDIESY